jgi:PAP_fibrillin
MLETGCRLLPNTLKVVPFSTQRPINRGSPRTQAFKQVDGRRNLRAFAVATTTATATAPPTTTKQSNSLALPLLGKSSASADIKTILDCLAGVTGRGKGGMAPELQSKFDAAVERLEKSNSSTGISSPTASPLLQGRWRLLYTSRPGTASPIQRSFTGVDAFTVYQEICFPPPTSSTPATTTTATPSKKKNATAVSSTIPRVNNIVDFGPEVGLLKVEAEASTDTRPLPGFIPRKGKGLPFGILGVSSTTPPATKNLRIDFQFDQAAFYFKKLPFTIPYPVPFKLLGDETKGWIDITYLSKDGKFRLTRGNKGTLFVLIKDDPPQERLLERIAAKASDAELSELVEKAAAQGGGVKLPAKSTIATGNWKLLWTKQGSTANPLQKVLASSVRNWQIISSDGTKLENRVELLPGVRVRAMADSEPDSGSRTGVEINEVIIEVGGLKLPLPVKQDARGYIDWLYLDENMRITQGSKGSVFVHVRDLNFDKIKR